MVVKRGGRGLGHSARKTSIGEFVGGGATAPALTQTSAAGVNPLAWSTAYTDLIPDADDYVTLRYRENGGAWVNETPVLVTSAWVATYVVDGTPHPWPLYDADTFPASTLVEVQGGVTRGADATVWSNIVSDTMAAGPALGAMTLATSTNVFTSTGSGTNSHTYTAVPFPAGRPLIIFGKAGSAAFDSVTINGASATLVKYNGDREIWVGPTDLAAGSYNVVANRAGSVISGTQNIFPHAIVNMGTGTVTSTALFAVASGQNGDVTADASITVANANNIGFAFIASTAGGAGVGFITPTGWTLEKSWTGEPFYSFTFRSTQVPVINANGSNNTMEITAAGFAQ